MSNRWCIVKAVLAKNVVYPFNNPTANPAARPLVSGIPKFPSTVDTCPESVKEFESVVTEDWDTDCSLSQLTLIRPCDWRYIKAAKKLPAITARIFITRFIAKPARKPITPPEPIENRVEEKLSIGISRNIFPILIVLMYTVSIPPVSYYYFWDS
jgi:hypothetical protein